MSLSPSPKYLRLGLIIVALVLVSAVAAEAAAAPFLVFPRPVGPPRPLLPGPPLIAPARPLLPVPLLPVPLVIRPARPLARPVLISPPLPAPIVVVGPQRTVRVGRVVVAAPGPLTNRIVNPAEWNVRMTFNVNATQYTLAPGESQDLYGHQPRTIEFHRGGEFGTQRYRLSGGQYTFTPTENGWELLRSPLAQ